MTQEDLLGEFISEVNVPNASLEQEGNRLVITDGETTVHVVENDEMEDVPKSIDIQPRDEVGEDIFGLSPRESADYVECLFAG